MIMPNKKKKNDSIFEYHLFDRQIIYEIALKKYHYSVLFLFPGTLISKCELFMPYESIFPYKQNK